MDVSILLSSLYFGEVIRVPVISPHYNWSYSPGKDVCVISVHTSNKNQSQDVNSSSVAVETLPSLKRVDGRDTLGMSLARKSTP